MKMDPADIKRFRKLHFYVSVNLPEVRKVHVIIKTMKDLSGTIDEQTIKDALLWNQGPEIKIVKNLGAFGKFRFHKSTNEIRIDEDLVKEFQAGKGLRKTPNGQMVYLVGVTLLHELTHWADSRDGTDDAVPGDPTNEEGEEFERRLYGGVID